MPYNRSAAVAYAHKWALKRNPAYFNFTGVGGDCTNFISQCLRAGGAPMNYTHDVGWYYNSPTDRAAAWTGVEYLYNFLTGPHKPGPHATLIPAAELQAGDIVQICFHPDHFSHGAIVVRNDGKVGDFQDIYVAAHSIDSDYRPLSSYDGLAYRFLRIEVRP